MQIEVTIDRNYVEILGKRIDRPSSMAPSQWLLFWQPVDGGHQAELDHTGSK